MPLLRRQGISTHERPLSFPRPCLVNQIARAGVPRKKRRNGSHPAAISIALKLPKSRRVAKDHDAVCKRHGANSEFLCRNGRIVMPSAEAPQSSSDGIMPSWAARQCTSRGAAASAPANLPLGLLLKPHAMSDFSLQSVQSRSAKVDDKLVTRDFGTGTRGFRRCRLSRHGGVFDAWHRTRLRRRCYLPNGPAWVARDNQTSDRDMGRHVLAASPTVWLLYRLDQHLDERPPCDRDAQAAVGPRR
jgi:hypothetical protein